MKRTAACLFSAALLLSACSGTSNDTSGGGSGGTTGSGGVAGGTGGTGGAGGTTTTTTSGGGGMGGCGAPADNVYDNVTQEEEAADCIPVAPAPGEDGTFAVTVFGPFAKPFSVAGFSFTALESDMTGITDPWTASVILMPAGTDPLAMDVSSKAKPYPLTFIEDVPGMGNGQIKRYSITLDAPLSVGACDTVLVSLRNTEGPPLTGLMMCSLPGGSSHSDTNQWWDMTKDPKMAQMSTFGANFDRNWSVSLVPAP